MLKTQINTGRGNQIEKARIPDGNSVFNRENIFFRKTELLHFMFKM